MGKMGRDIILAIIGILGLVLLFTVLSTVCKADKLIGIAGYRAVLLNMLHASSGHNDWPDSKLDECINAGVCFVEGVGKGNLVHDTLTFKTNVYWNVDAKADTGFFYELTTDMVSGGVLNIVYYDSYARELRALSQRNAEDFGKDMVDNESPAKFPYMYSVAFDTLMVYPLPDEKYVMHITSYKVSNWMTGEEKDTMVSLPIFHRLLALEMAYGYAQLSTGTAEGFQRYTQIRQGVLEIIYGLPPEPLTQVQSLGLEGEGQ